MVEEMVWEEGKGREDWDKLAVILCLSQEILLGVGAYYAPRATCLPYKSICFISLENFKRKF